MFKQYGLLSRFSQSPFGVKWADSSSPGRNAVANASAPSTENAVNKIQRENSAKNIGPLERRTLQTVTNTGTAATSSTFIPIDTAIERMSIDLLFACTVAYSSGSPVLSPMGLMGRLVPNISIVADGSRPIKSFDLNMARMLTMLQYGNSPRRGFQKGASLQGTTFQPTTEWDANTVSYPTTTQDLIVQEQVEIFFANNRADKYGKWNSLLYTKNLSTCFMNMTISPISQILDTGNTAVVTYTNVSITFIPTIIENREADVSSNAYDFVESIIPSQFSSAGQKSIQLITGNRVIGLLLRARNGDTAQTLSDTAITDLALKINGSIDVATTNFRNVQNDMKARFLAYDEYASSGHPSQGFSYMQLIKGEAGISGIDTRLEAGVSSLYLYATAAASSGVPDPATYTNPVSLDILEQQYQPVPQKQ